MFENEKEKITDEEFTKIAQTLQYSDETLCTSEGDLYRIATITDERFSDDAAINPIESWASGNALPDKLNLGLFSVEADLDFDLNYEKLKVV